MKAKNQEHEEHVKKYLERVGTPLSRNINQQFDEQLTFGDKLADKMTSFAGSWRFISFCGIFLGFWVAMNLYLLSLPFDPFPFILLNLFLSTIAALQAPIIMMSQNRQSIKDRLQAEHDYQINLKAEAEVAELHRKVDEINEKLWDIREKLK